MSVMAIVHPSNLLGKELRETVGFRGAGTTWQEVRLLTTDDQDVGTLTEAGGAAALVQRYEPAALDGASAVFFCGPVVTNRALLGDVPPDATAVLLSTDATAADGAPVVAGINSRPAGARVLLSPHPAAVLLAHLIHPLAGVCRPRALTATVVQPASLFEQAGLEDLFEQARQIVALSQRRRSPVFGKQLAFNVMPAQYGGEAATAITEAVAAVLPDAASLSVQVLQGGIFHGVAVSLRVTAEDVPAAKTVRQALAASPYVEAADDVAHLGPIDAAANDKVLLGAVRKDADGFWLWAVMDNLTRGGALNALEIAAAVH